MANEQHFARLRQGMEAWNAWRLENPDTRPELSRANLLGANLTGVDLSGANLFGANLTGANLNKASLFEANLNQAQLFKADLSLSMLGRAKFFSANLDNSDLHEAFLEEADLSSATLVGANLSGADLSWANIVAANLSNADLSWANLRWVRLIGTDMSGSTINNCRVFGISAWDLRLDNAKQENLIIDFEHKVGNQPAIFLDNIDLAQFINLLLFNEKIRDAIDTITSKVVLILGRFTPERKVILDALREELRKRNYLPILFDFDKPASRDITETVSILGHMARFIIADITDAKSIPQELMAIVPDLPSVPIQPMLQIGAAEYAMFEHFRRFPWVLETFEYQDVTHALASLENAIITPAERKVTELRPKELKP